ncbi:MAG TPA: ABC transporter permease, partial [Fimbriimonadaceae bacterium]|nr:ABC transporter permease [Fimbriimonadaceae bacterium]
VGTALNLLSLGLTSSLYRASFGQTGAAISLPGLPQWQGLDPIASFTLLAVPLAAAVMFRTNWGLAVRAVGELPRAAEASGFRVARLRGQALLVGGFFAGLAGAYLAVGITGSFNENMTAGRGFLAIALVTFGRWNPWLILFASLLVGYVTSLQFTMQASGITLPKELLIALPYLAALAVLVLVGRGVDAPAALARPYRKEG